jgi:cytochrome c peroxidase
MSNFNISKKVLATIVLLSFFSCFLQSKLEHDAIEFSIPSMVFEKENFATNKRIELGKKLFFDPIFSIDSSMSCASCHIPEFAFSDTQKFSPGVFGREGVRNTPSLVNVGFHPYYLREGSVPTIEMQALIPIQEKNEFAHNIVEISKKIQKIESYVDLSEQAYNRKPDHYVITRALGVFQRTLISNSSKFDLYLKEKVKFTKQEKKGMRLFFGKAACYNCHSGFNFTNYKLTNNGLYEEYKDEGRMRATKDSNDLSVFKTPSLRNIAITGPYMHDGSFDDLEQVIIHYNSGGKNHLNKDKLIKPLGLNKAEMQSLISFLNTLTDIKLNKNLERQ